MASTPPAPRGRSPRYFAPVAIFRSANAASIAARGVYVTSGGEACEDSSTGITANTPDDVLRSSCCVSLSPEMMPPPVDVADAPARFRREHRAGMIH